MTTDEALSRLVDLLGPFMDREFCSPFYSAWELSPDGPYRGLDGETLHEAIRLTMEDAKKALGANQSRRCPICGEAPSSVEMIKVPTPSGLTRNVPGTMHCPNENDPAHVASR